MRPMQPRELLGGAVTALRTLTLLPVPGREGRSLASALFWFPFVGLLVGGLGWGLASALLYIEPGWVAGAAFVVILLSAFITRGLHLDGLADMADGFGGARERARTLEIMKDSRVGAFGVIAIVLVLLAKWVILTHLLESEGGLWIIVAAVLSRAAMVELARSQPYARRSRGMGAEFVSGAGLEHVIVAVMAALTVTVVFVGWGGGIVCLIVWCMVIALGHWFRRRVGGVTGDLLGASSELVETTVLFFGALFGRHLVELVSWT